MKFLTLCFLASFFWSAHTLALCVQVEKANLRAGPNTNTQKTWEVYKFMPFEHVKTQSGWHQVKDVDGDMHWVSGRLVSESLECAVVKVQKANLRAGPGTNHKAVPWGPAQKYYAFKVLSRQGSWVHIEDAAGGKAWVHQDLIWIPRKRSGTPVATPKR